MTIKENNKINMMSRPKRNTSGRNETSQFHMRDELSNTLCNFHFRSSKMNSLRLSSKCFTLLNHGSTRKYGIFGNFFNRSNKKDADDKFLVGEDQLGNTYFEKPPSPDAPRQVPKRWIKYSDDMSKKYTEEDRHFLFTDAEIPVEWKAWLQMKRKSPPTLEEIIRNEAIKLRTIQRAKELEEKEREEKLIRTKAGELAESDPSSQQPDFPVYPEYPEYTTVKGYREDYLKTDSGLKTDNGLKTDTGQKNK